MSFALFGCLVGLVCWYVSILVLECMRFLSTKLVDDYVVSHIKGGTHLQEEHACLPLAFSTLPSLKPTLHIPRTDRQTDRQGVHVHLYAHSALGVSLQIPPV